VKRRSLIAYIAAGTAATLSGCLSAVGLVDDGACSGGDCDIGMTRNAFVPETYHAEVGETVVWKNTTAADHTVTAYENAIPEEADYFATGGYDGEEEAREEWHRRRGGRIGTGETYEHTFEVPGEHPYVCIPHEKGEMVGTVVVEE